MNLVCRAVIVHLADARALPRVYTVIVASRVGVGEASVCQARGRRCCTGRTIRVFSTIAVGLLVASGVAVLAPSDPASATFPGQIGRIATQFDLALSTSGVDPTPYDGVLTRLSVKIGGEQPLYIGRTGTTLRIEGSQRTIK